MTSRTVARPVSVDGWGSWKTARVPSGKRYRTREPARSRISAPSSANVADTYSRDMPVIT